MPTKRKCPKCKAPMDYNSPNNHWVCKCGHTIKKGTPRPTGGRKSTYTKEIALAICERLSVGESLVTICKRDDMPSVAGVLKWLADPRYSEFVELYARARGDQADYYFEEICTVRDRLMAGEIDPNTARVAIDSIKWQMGKLKPHKYSDKMQIEHDQTITVEVVRFKDADED